MAATRKVIITCAITGSIHTPSMSPHLPVTPKEIADAAVGAAEAGAAIVHLHARDPVDGRPTQDPEFFREFAPDIRKRCDVVDQLHDRRRGDDDDPGAPAPALELKPEVASLNMGSMNFGLYPMLERFREFKFDWEREYLAPPTTVCSGTRSRTSSTSSPRARTTARASRSSATTSATCTRRITSSTRGIVKPPLFIQSVFGILGGIGAHPDDVAHMKRTADRLFGDNYRWSVLGAGRNQLPIAAMSAAMGGNVRVGLEDSLWIGPGKLAESNAAQVRAARQVIEGLGLAVATPDEAREILALKGAANVGF